MIIDMNRPSLKCKKCSHEWIPRVIGMPKACPNCNSRKYNEERCNQAHAKTSITHKDLLDEVVYCKETGVFTRREYRPFTNGKKGAVLGSFDKKSGYKRLSVKGEMFLMHRLAWFYVHGYFPENIIDHINGDRADNRISNLREVSNVCNSRNQKVRSNSKTGVTGVRKNGYGKYTSTIGVDGKAVYLGTYPKIIDAVKARWEAEKLYGYPNCLTDSSALKYIEKHIGRNH